MDRRAFLGSVVATPLLSGCLQTNLGDEPTDDEAGTTDDPGSQDDRVAPILPADADGDAIPDAWEREGRTPTGLALPDCDPDHRDLYLDIVSLKGSRMVSASDVEFIQQEFAEMPVQNPDGDVGIDLHVHGPREIDLTVEGLRELEGNDLGKIGPIHADALYHSEFMGDRSGIYHLLGVLPGDTYIRGKGGFASQRVAMIKTFNRQMMIHQLLRTLIGPNMDEECLGKRHTCDGYLTRPPGRYFSDQTVEWLQHNQFDTNGQHLGT